MPILNEDRKYQRILHSKASEQKLEENGYEVLLSSNVSAAARRGDDLIIRFHNGSLYKYPNQGKNFLRLVAASSHGKWVWRFLRRPNKPYMKIGSLPLPEDRLVSDEEIIKPRKPKYKVEAIVPLDFMTTGALPQISITPIEQATAIMGTLGTGGGGGLNTLLGVSALSTMGNSLLGIISATKALGIIKGT